MNHKLIIFMFLPLLMASQSSLKEKKYRQEEPYDTICLSKTTYLSLSLETTKSEMYKKLGKPDKIVKPKYDCGGFSDEWQDKIFKQYYYKSLNFIGAGENMVIERINFEANPSISIMNKGVIINSKTTIKTFAKLFPKSYKNIVKGKDGKVYFYLLPSLVTDDKIIVTFKKGVLISLQYNSPC